MKKDMLTEILFLKKKTRSARKKYSIVNLLELILVKKIRVQIMKLVEYKHPLLNQLKKKWLMKFQK